MKILHVTPSLQHPLVRGPDRHYQLLRELSQRHDVTHLTLARSEVPPAAMEELQELSCGLHVIDVTTGGKKSPWPTAVGRRLHREWRFQVGLSQMKKTFRRLTGETPFDVVFFHGKSVYPVIQDFEACPIVTDFCDATSFRVRSKIGYAGKLKRPFLWFRYLKVRATERKMIEKSSRLFFISRRDREKIMGADDASPIVSNGINLQYWKRRSDERRPNSLIFTGIMDYGPNEDAALFFIDKILPLLKESNQEVEVIIAGRSPTPALQQRGERHPQVTVTGFVDDMRDPLEKAALFVAPLRYGSGQQNKILEALAMEVPVITTPLALEGVRVDGAQPPICVAEDAPAFARGVVQLLQDSSERNRLAAAGRRYVQDHFSWSHSARQVERMCQEVMEGIP